MFPWALTNIVIKNKLLKDTDEYSNSIGYNSSSHPFIHINSANNDQAPVPQALGTWYTLYSDRKMMRLILPGGTGKIPGVPGKEDPSEAPYLNMD